MKNKLKFLIEQIIEEQWSAVTSSDIFGKDRNNGNVEPANWDWQNQDDSSAAKTWEYKIKLQELEPVIKQSQQYKLFLQELGNTNPDDESSLFKMYENFLHYFSIKKEDFQDGDSDDKTAALAVAEYFKYVPDRIVQ